MNVQEPRIHSSTTRRLWNNRTLLLMCFPSAVLFILFCYIPMPGLYIAFTKYNYAAGIFGSKFVGLINFKFLTISGELLKLTVNTILYNIAFIITGNIIQIVVALMLNEIRSRGFRKVTQTMMLLPYFISYVLVGILAYSFISYDYGIVNGFLKSIGAEPIEIYSNASVWPTIIVLVNIWKTTGYGCIIYFAALVNIDPEMIEASMIDGAGPMARIKYMLLPSLRPTFVILLLFSLGGILRGNFGLFYNLVGANNSSLFATTDIIETFVFRALVNNFNFSMGSAVSLYQSVLGFFIVVSCNWFVRKIEPDYALF